MPRLLREHLTDLAVRFAMIALCICPFTSPRQAAAAVGFPPPPAFAGQLPTAPLNSEEENERTEEVKGRVGHQAEYRPDAHRLTLRLPSVPTQSAIRTTSATCPSPADPFHNGLGSPYRC